MSSAAESSLGIVAYLALFIGAGFAFLFVSLALGRLFRPSNPHEAKGAIYECGEPTIGSSFVQFDLRFYVVALLFIIFDVEVAFFFPWAVVFGKAANMMEDRFPVVAKGGASGLTPEAEELFQELGVRKPKAPETVPASLADEFAGRFRKASASSGQPPGQEIPVREDAEAEFVVHRGARQLALLTVVDILVFFAVLMVGFAYVWKRGDLDWVRAVGRGEPQAEPAAGAGAQREAILSS
jgi:NADH-quinone oxidoreductase subunit A